MNLHVLRARAEIIRLMRAWFFNQGFVEMHTPRLVSIPGQEPHLEPFTTEVVEASGAKHPAVLITSPEYAMKRLLAEGMERIYDLGPCYRNNEPWDGTHDPEFLMVEWYRRDADVNDLMDDTENMILSVAREFRVEPEALTRSWRRVTVEEAFREYLDVELSPLLEDRAKLAELAVSLNQTVTDDDSWDDIFFKIFLTHIEPKLGVEQPTFLYKYPASMAALARRSKDDPRYADRVELYIGGLELANGFAELSDPVEQRERFIEERVLRAKLGKQIWPLDERFLSALPAMGNAAGIAFGVDRLVMLLTNSKSINDVVPFSARERFQPEEEKQS
ncbi:MAG: EF-P lysine aminoacylase EpmA [Patescibacteria group bacterium]